jgi:glycosyltransferase involved in cell wall biosynthesis
MTPEGDVQLITVCIPSVRAATIEAAIRSVQRQTWPGWELVIVMQGEDEQLRAKVRDASLADPRIRGVWLAERGVSRARNVGVAEARGGAIAFLDDDCEAAPDWLARLRTAWLENPDVGVIAGSLVAPPAPRWPISKCPSAYPTAGILRHGPDDPDMPSETWLASANLGVRQWAWEVIGPFDEHLGPGTEFPAGEDLDFFLRAIRHRVPIRFLPEAEVIHTYGRRVGVRAVWKMLRGYGSGQGAVAAKMTLFADRDPDGWNGTLWRKQAWREAILDPLKSLRPHQIVRALPRQVAFERSYRACMRAYTVNDRGLLVAHSRVAQPSLAR